jgi:hypothetical protein
LGIAAHKAPSRPQRSVHLRAAGCTWRDLQTHEADFGLHFVYTLLHDLNSQWVLPAADRLGGQARGQPFFFVRASILRETRSNTFYVILCAVTGSAPLSSFNTAALRSSAEITLDRSSGSATLPGAAAAAALPRHRAS